MTNLGGIHDREGAAISPPGVWIVDTIALSENPTPPAYDPAIAWIVRVNWNYGSAGTLPVPDGYGEYVARLKRYVSQSGNCHRWIIGNEPNLSREWPDGQPIFPWHYAGCYKAARSAIRSIPGHEQDEVLIAASGPWNDQLKYEGNPAGDWITYFEDVIQNCGDNVGGFALHAYTHGYHVNRVTSSARMDAPFQHRHYEFRTYRDYIEAIPDRFAHLPIYITEANGDGPWQAVGLMPAMLNEIDNWNKQSSRKVRAVVFYRGPAYDHYNIMGKPDVEAEYQQAMGRGYTSPIMGTDAAVQEQETFIPVVSSGPQTATPPLPPREWDERLTARGVTVETPSVAPGSPFWRVTKAQWFDEQQAGGRYHIYVDAPAGTRLRAVWPDGFSHFEANGKTGFDAGNYPMGKSLREFSVYVDDGTPSEVVKGIGRGDYGNPNVHTSTLVRFERVTMPQSQQQPPAPPVTVPLLKHPIADPALRVISQHFGVNPDRYARFGMAGHNGVDFAVPQGTPIGAVAPGAVVESQSDPDGYGEYVKLRHPWGESLYAHLRTRKVAPGDHLNAGQVVGTSGNTGNSTGPHLHLGVRVFLYQRGWPFDGYSDPLPYLTSQGEPAQPTDVVGAIKTAAQEFGVDPDLLLSQAWAESSFDPRAVSHAGAQGLLQIMPATWAEWSPKIGAGSDPFNAAQNARVGAAYLKWLLSLTGNNPYQALIAYGWGIGNWQGDKPRPAEWIAYANKIMHGSDLLKAVTK